MNARLSSPLIFAILGCLVTCRTVADDGKTQDRDFHFFEQHIRPVLVEHCYACHSVEADSREGGLLLDSREGWQQGGENGPAISMGNATNSLLIRALKYGDRDLQMPPDGPLPPEDIRRFEQWVAMGAPDPREAAVPPREPKDAGLNASDPIAGREHWAFKRLTQTTPPVTTGVAWALDGSDGYIYAKLLEQGLGPAGPAEREKLARRLYLLLWGLPPTQQQLREFVSDPRPDWLERAVDRLLSSPRFGEVWGRHWLDLARYSDSNGLDENFLFREAWRYRNWVFSKVDEDLPFDDFLLMQIAGDLLPYDSLEQRDEQRIAAGFLVMGPKVLLGNNAQERAMDVADEQLDTIGRTVLGQSLGCARCHDHKFDPIPTTDYYALAGIMTSTEVMETRHMLGQQRLMERLVGIGVAGDQRDAEYEAFWREHPALKARHERAARGLRLLEEKKAQEFGEHAREHPNSIADEAADVRVDVELRQQAQQDLVTELAKELANPPPIPARAMIPKDAEQPVDEAVRIAGQFDRKGEVVPRGFLQVLSDKPIELPEHASGRRELAAWLTDVEHGAGHLSARVLANRVWFKLMGRGLVRTVDNFGRTGETPSHAELLDFLALELIRSDWSVKHLVRKIVLSQTFRMSCQHNEAAYAIDPDNRLYWRASRRRLEPEALRDSMLLVGKQLDLNPMDSTVWYLGDQATAVGANKNRRRTDFPCRSVYLPVIRNDLPELFDAFDFADPHATTGMRPQTIVATQGLYLLNDESVLQAARATAERLLTQFDEAETRELLREMVDLVLGYPLSKVELNALEEFVQMQLLKADQAEQKVAELTAWSAVCQALFASSYFQLLE